MALYSYEIGATGPGLVNVESLTVPLPAPKGIFQDYTEVIELGDGTVRGVGFPAAVWRWGFLTQAQRDQLRTFCTGASNEVYIKTRTNDSADSYGLYTAVMVWPTEEKDAQRRLDFAVLFRHLVVYVP